MSDLLVPVIGIIAAIIAAASGYFFTEKSKLSARERRLKENCYIEYIDAISNNVLSESIEDSKSRLSQAHNQILLIGSSEVVRDLRVFSVYIGPDIDEFDQNKHDILLTNLIKSMRYDLYHKKKINRGYPQIAVSGRRRR